MIAVLVNVDWYIYSHRLELFKELGRKHPIKIYTQLTEKARLNNMVHFNFFRGSKNPLIEVFIILRLLFLLKMNRAYMLHLISIKPLIYGNILARVLNIPTISAVSGLGSVIGADYDSGKWLTKAIKWSLQGRNQKYLVFQNKDDKRDFLTVFHPKNYKITLTKGSGINLNQWNYITPIKKDKLIVLLSSRIIKEKGIYEFFHAAQLMEKKWSPKCRFVLAGRLDMDNPNSITQQEIEKLKMGDYFSWVGNVTNMQNLLSEADIVVLPSYYREGIPKSLIEACAVGRPIVTTDAIGCRECVDEGINGFKVPIKDAVALSEAMEKLLLDEALRISMGKNSRLKAEREFDVSGVIEKHLEIYEQLLN
jgi:glycosyltransferase involved in cell wall biosynthesis